MNEIIAFIERNKLGSLATCDGEKADIRPFELVFHSDRGLFFYTSDGEDVYRQLRENPNIAFCATDRNYNYTKITGSVSFSDSDADKAKILSNSQFAKEVFAGSGTEDMKVFFLPHASCMLHYHADGKAVPWQF
ncbi:pyridoxamine 5'-phosphate oxidase family protein [Papillibacter cinnamivorans]|uniref:Uncharacterized protein, pyridoxamine 5'-phosphate oxidase (PNPOx-like) family n=1 Tax=Papillibacter cinnamivorans DSM 12816 TaxID=1122930 RepID=A0A1W2C947_9FIRM|nr:pyridoxamine 5'-phosphate oxidase family protein [Papillibacter cinnamivorans]SMC81807.1 Uncharacterized protein, pyridoxamine 5'-phosphate oxidase (PNPOx-like) family [Papillibacter cinnamivorans DSM 12816]